MVNLRFSPQSSSSARPSLLAPAGGTGVASSAGTVVLQPWEAVMPWGIYESAGSHHTTGTDTIGPLMANLSGNKLDTVFWTNHSVYRHQLGHPSAFQTQIDASVMSTCRQIIGETGLYDATHSLTNDWFGNLGHAFDDTTAASYVAASLAFWADKANMIGWSVLDDATHNGLATDTTGQTSQKSEPLVRVLQQASGGRFATCTPTSSAAIAGAGAVQDMSDVGARALVCYLYPFGNKKNDGTYTAGAGTYVNTAEGDMHASKESQSSTHEWSDELRLMLAGWPDDRPVWMAMQAHDTTVGGTVLTSTTLRYPTAREIREYAWCAIGEGVKGFLWFTWSDINGWQGISNAARADVLAVIREMGGRLRTSIRNRIVKTKRDTTAPFSATGGGNVGNSYTNGYCSTLIDRYDSTRYVVLCNRALSTQNMVVTSGTLSGSLVSLETGTTYALGANIALGALDGTILRFIPA